MEKLTNVKALELVLGMAEVRENAELVEKLEKMKEQFAKKNASRSADGTKTLTKDQQLNEKIKEVILEVLGRYEEPKMIKELQTENEEISSDKYSNQKMSALLRQLVKDGKVVRVEEKGKAKFGLA